MKSKLLILASIFAVVISMSACGNNATASDSEYGAAYDKIVTEYQEAFDDLKKGSENMNETYPDIALETLYEYEDVDSLDDLNMKYALCDINGDGQDEFIVGYDPGNDGYINVMGLYSANGDEPVSLVEVDRWSATAPFGYELGIMVDVDAGYYYLDLVSADEGIIQCKIADDGFSPVLVEKYAGMYDEDDEYNKLHEMTRGLFK